MKYLDKFSVDRCFICVLFFANRHCHVALTSQENPGKFVAGLASRFLKIGLDSTQNFIASLGYVNHWERVQDKYRWRYLMHIANFQIVNLDGSEFRGVDVANETWDELKLDAWRELDRYRLRPILNIARAERKRRGRKFLPRQEIREAVANADESDCAYTQFEKDLLRFDYVTPELFTIFHS